MMTYIQVIMKKNACTPVVARAIRKLGSDLGVARRNRRLSETSLAAAAGISRSTLQRLEAGDPGVSLQTMAVALQVLGELARLETLMDIATDNYALVALAKNPPKKIYVRKTRKANAGPAAEWEPVVDPDKGAAW
jgi:transcriptional regulator with XRE-family HTH domain